MNHHSDRMSNSHGIRFNKVLCICPCLDRIQELYLIDCVYTCNHIDRMSSTHGIRFNKGLCICPCSDRIQVHMELY